MKPILFILIFSSFSYAQQVSLFEQFELEAKGYGYIPDSLIYIEFRDIIPIVDDQPRKFSIQISGNWLEYIFDIFYNENDTSVFITTYTYSITDVRRSRTDKNYFKGYKIKRKSIWKLLYKTTQLDSALSNTLINQILKIDFSQLPTIDTLQDKYGRFFDGSLYIFNSFDEEGSYTYEVGSSHIEQLSEFDQVLSSISKIYGKKEYKVDLESGKCHNSRRSYLYLCRPE